MKTILCYGDSNTYGYNPSKGSRLDENSRWSGILKTELADFKIIEEGLNNRTGITISPNGIEYSPILHIPNYFKKNKPDIIILAIGTNDFQFSYNITKEIIYSKLEKLILFIKNENVDIILIPPVAIKKEILNSWFSNLFDEKSIQKSKDSIKIYRKIAHKFNCKYFDFNEIVEPSNFDGLHFDRNAHKIIASALKNFILENY